jgi:hypothetical protein
MTNPPLRNRISALEGGRCFAEARWVGLLLPPVGPQGDVDGPGTPAAYPLVTRSDDRNFFAISCCTAHHCAAA